MKSVKAIVIAVFALMTAFTSQAVTDKEMEEAKTITAKAYLRWVNNGSDYLDNLSVKTMSELNSRLKSKEKENIKAFNSIRIPSDYAQWDKEKLVEFWSVTFFKSPGLDEKGKGARIRVRKQISDMSVSAPASEATPAKEDAAAPEAPEDIEAAANDEPVPEMAANAREDILSDQNAIEKDAEEAQAEPREEQSHTWLYVIVLAILVAVVIWLVVYAANLMKRQPADDDKSDSGDRELRAQARKAIAAKNEEIEDLHRRLQAEENKCADLGIELEKMKLECSRFESRLAQLREENNRLQNAATESRRGDRAPERTVIAAPRPERRIQESVVEPAEEPAAPILKVIYLGRANRRGIFVRADRRINAGNTIYRLDTNDGLVGTFHVVDEPEVVDVALSSPMDYLANGCIGEDLEDTAGVTRIVTESAGTAIFENGYWKVLRKTKIRYE